MRWIENDSLFREQLAAGYAWQQYLLDAIKSEGVPATLPPLVVRQTIDQIPEFVDSADIRVGSDIIEVKSRNLVFGDVKSFPFADIFVDTVPGWEGKAKKPIAYACISQVTGAVIWTPGDDCRDWQVVTKRDGVRHIQDRFYVAHKSLWREYLSLIAFLQLTTMGAQ